MIVTIILRILTYILNLTNQTGSPLKKPCLIVFFCTCRLLFLFFYIYELLYTQNFQKHQLLPAVHNHTKLLVSFQKHPQILHIRSVWKKITKEPIHTLKDEMLMLVDTSTPAI